MPEVRYQVLSSLARSAYQADDYQSAVDLYEQALAVARESGNRSAIATTLSFLAFAREEIGEDVTVLLEESLSICRELNDFEGMAMALNQLGDASLATGETQRAGEQYLQAANIAGSLGNSPLTALAWLNLGDLATEQERWTDAENYYKRSLDAHANFDNPISRAIVLTELGRSYSKQGNLKKAQEFIEASATIRARSEDWEDYAENLFDLAWIAQKAGRSEEARKHANHVVDILRRIDSSYTSQAEAALAEFELGDSPAEDAQTDQIVREQGSVDFGRIASDC